MDVTFEERYFKNNDEWTYFLGQLHIPEEKWLDIDEIKLDVADFTATDSDGNELTI